MISFVDSLLNRITMYRLVMYFTALLAFFAFILAFFDLVPYSPWALLLSYFFFTFCCWISNELLAKFFNAAANTESVYITAFILFLIVPPALLTDLKGMLFILFASVLAMASKYVLAINKKHIFNPAAVAVVITAFAFNDSASWWVGGNVWLLPVVLVGGLLIVRKIQRFDLFLSFLIVAFATIMIHSRPESPWDVAQKIILHTPIFFFGTIMLTEPSATPPTRGWRMAYGALAGLLYGPFVHLGPVYSTPELDLVVVNIFSYIVSPKVALQLTLERVEQAAENVYTFIFKPDRRFSFAAGQYLEWTLPHKKVDQRGNRRYFTIASAPAREQVAIGIKTYEPSSSFKKKLLSLKPGDTITAGSLAGDFTLPKNPKTKLAFIAGGIGITPFKAMVEQMLDRNEKRNTVLFYSNKTVAEVAYKDLFDKASKDVGLKTIYAITNEDAPAGMHQGFIDYKLIEQTIPDFKERTFYLSGPRAMVEAFEKTLAAMGVMRINIKTDFFPGLV